MNVPYNNNKNNNALILNEKVNNSDIKDNKDKKYQLTDVMAEQEVEIIESQSFSKEVNVYIKKSFIIKF